MITVYKAGLVCVTVRDTEVPSLLPGLLAVGTISDEIRKLQKFWM
ncbi:hypothetical protein [Coleofasciculus sp. FACHB-1120]|nr:hypothetical protein [Coleofasciculus sp. FACHB-1120]